MWDEQKIEKSTWPSNLGLYSLHIYQPVVSFIITEEDFYNNNTVKVVILKPLILRSTYSLCQEETTCQLLIIYDYLLLWMCADADSDENIRELLNHSLCGWMQQ